MKTSEERTIWLHTPEVSINTLHFHRCGNLASNLICNLSPVLLSERMVNKGLSVVSFTLMSWMIHITRLLRSHLCFEWFMLLDYYFHSFILDDSCSWIITFILTSWMINITELLRSHLCLELVILLDYYVHSFILDDSCYWIITYRLTSWIIHVTGLLYSHLCFEWFMLLDYYVHTYVLNNLYYWIITFIFMS
jgi:hypothetical protein